MAIPLTSDHVNYLIWRYLQESGFEGASFSFEDDSKANLLDEKYGARVKTGALIHVLQKGLQYMSLESSISKARLPNGREIPGAQFSFFGPSIENQQEVLRDQALHGDLREKPAEKQDISMRSPSPEAVAQEEDAMQVDKLPESPQTNGHTPTKRIREDTIVNGTPKPVIQPSQKIKRARHSHEAEDKAMAVNGITEPDTASEEVRATLGESVGTQVDFIEFDHNSKDVIKLSVDDFLEPAAMANGCTFNPIYNQILATSYENCHLFKFDIRDDPADTSFQETALYHRLGDEITSMVWSDGGDYLGTGSYKGVIRVWETNGGGTLRWTFNLHRSPIMALKFSPSQELLISVDGQRYVGLWDMKQGRMLRALEMTQSRHPMDVEWFHDTSFVVVGSEGAVESFEGGQQSPTPFVHEGHAVDQLVSVVKWDANVGMFATAGDDQKIILWKQRQSLPEAVLEGHTAPINKLLWSTVASGHSEPKTFLASCSDDWSVRIWDPSRRTCLQTMVSHLSPVQTLAVSPDGRFLASGGSNAVVMIWLVDGGHLAGVYDSSKQQPEESNGETHDGPSLVEDISWDKDGNRLAVAVEGQKCVAINWTKLLESAASRLDAL